MTHCPRCHEVMIHGGDDDFEGVEVDVVGIVSNFSCPVCGVRLDVYLPQMNEDQSAAVLGLEVARREEAPAFDEWFQISSRLGAAGVAVLLDRLQKKWEAIEKERDRFKEMASR